MKTLGYFLILIGILLTFIVPSIVELLIFGMLPILGGIKLLRKTVRDEIKIKFDRK